MEIIVCKDYMDMSRKAAELAAACVNAAGGGLISFPAGDTPVGMVGCFADMVNGGEADIANTRYIALDEWVGLGADDEGSCALFNRTKLLGALKRPFLDVHLIDGLNPDVQKERQALEEYLLRHGPLKVSVLGVGLNGHLGFNEDGVDFEQDTIVIPLSATTKQVMKKYFGEQHHPEYGISIGVRQLMKAEKVILIANGENKADIIAKTVNGPITNSVPSSVLQRHPNCTVVLDRAAAAKLQGI